MRIRPTARALRASIAIVAVALLTSMFGSASVLSQSSSDGPDPSASTSPSPSPEPGTFSGTINWSETYEDDDDHLNGIVNFSASIELRMAWVDEGFMPRGGTYSYNKSFGGDCPRSWSGSGVIWVNSMAPIDFSLPSPGVGVVAGWRNQIWEADSTDLGFSIDLWQDENRSTCQQRGIITPSKWEFPDCVDVLGTYDAGPPVSYSLTCQKYQDELVVVALEGVLTQTP